MTTNASVPIEDYLQTSYKPDVEYIDGELMTKSGGEYNHARLRALLAGWFGEHEDAWSFVGALGVRTRVSPTRVRLPDVVIFDEKPQPDTLVDPPLLVIEVLSPSDSYSETQGLARDYQAMGIQNIWLIDPETRVGKICRGEGWIGVRRFEVVGTEIHLDLDELFARLDRKASTCKPKSSASPTVPGGRAQS